MTRWEVEVEERDRILSQLILPTYFESPDSGMTPTLVLVAGQPGAGRSRATGPLRAEQADLAVVTADDLRAFHPRFAELGVVRTPDALIGVTATTTAWMRDCIRYARENQRSLLLEGAFQDPAVAVGTLARFAAAGFQTRIVVVAVRRVESLLSVASLYLSNVRVGAFARLVSREAHDRAFEATRGLAIEAEGSSAVDQLTVIGRNGDIVFDAHRADGEAAIVGAVAALESEQSARLTRFDATQWLSELHHMTDFAMTRRDLPLGVTELLLELHEVALREVIPELRVPSDGKFISAIEQKTVTRLGDLQRSLPREEVIDLAAPVVTPVGPERGGISR